MSQDVDEAIEDAMRERDQARCELAATRADLVAARAEVRRLEAELAAAQPWIEAGKARVSDS